MSDDDWPLAPWMRDIGWETADLTRLEQTLSNLDDQETLMSDTIDRSDVIQEAALATRRYCLDCEVRLEEERRDGVLCRDCQARREARDRRQAIGV